MAPRPTGITRRGLMGAMGGALAGGALTSSLAEATGVTEQRDACGRPLVGGEKSANDVGVRTAPLIDSSLSYLAVTQFDFRSSNPTFVGFQGYDYFSAAGSFAAAGIPLPSGTRLREVTVYAKNGTGSPLYFDVSEIELGGALGSVHYVTIPAGASQYSPIRTTCDVTFYHGYSYSLLLNCPDNTVGVNAVLLGYENTGSYVPVTPYRCYDSRLSVWGRVAPNTGRVLDTTVAINTSTGAQVGTDMIPSTARAVTFNLQAVGATGANNFAITNGDALVAAASHIVFNSGTPTVANAGTVDVADGYVKIFGGSGPGSAHCILDITGYYV